MNIILLSLGILDLLACFLIYIYSFYATAKSGLLLHLLLHPLLVHKPTPYLVAQTKQNHPDPSI